MTDSSDPTELDHTEQLTGTSKRDAIGHLRKSRRWWDVDANGQRFIRFVTRNPAFLEWSLNQLDIQPQAVPAPEGLPGARELQEEALREMGVRPEDMRASRISSWKDLFPRARLKETPGTEPEQEPVVPSPEPEEPQWASYAVSERDYDKLLGAGVAVYERAKQAGKKR